MAKISTCLWFDARAEAAARFYVSLFKNARIRTITRQSAETARRSGQKPGAVLTVVMDLAGHEVMLLNGGGVYKLTEAASLVAHCDSQAEIDRLWKKLTTGGGKAIQCGWLTDKFGVTWQIVPKQLAKLIDPKHPDRAGRVLAAIMPMKKLNLKQLEKAYAGK